MDTDKTTDELCDIIVKTIGVPIPAYSYVHRMYISLLPENIKFGECVKGIERPELHNTFREACLYVINWKNEQK